MTQERDESEKDLLKEAVQKFLRENPFPGESEPFILVGLDHFKHPIPHLEHSNSYNLDLKNVAEESISIVDSKEVDAWDEKLREVGKPFGVHLELPDWYFGR